MVKTIEVFYADVVEETFNETDKVYITGMLKQMGIATTFTDKSIIMQGKTFGLIVCGVVFIGKKFGQRAVIHEVYPERWKGGRQ